MKSEMLNIISKYEFKEEDVYFEKVEENNGIGWFNVYLELRTSKWSDEHDSKYGVNNPDNDYNKDIFLNSIRIDKEDYTEETFNINDSKWDKKKEKLLEAVTTIEIEKNIKIIETYFRVYFNKSKNYISISLRSEKWKSNEL